MRKIALLLAFLMSSTAYAADNAVTVTNGSDVNLKSKDLGSGLQLMQHGILDSAGAEILGLLTASPAATSISGRLVTINTTLGTPFQAGGSIGNAFALDATLTTMSGKLPTSLTTAGADGVSNTLSGLQTYSRLLMFNGTTWDRLIGDTTSGIWVNIKAGAGSGGTALADGATFTQGVTSLTPIGCLFINSYTSITTGKAGVLSCTAAGSLHTTVDNTNANGSATSANSSPVVIASDQVAVAIKAASGVFASGSFASGSHASGSMASGAYASGSIGSGAVATGAYASGSIGSGAVASGAVASGAFASGSIGSGAVASGAVASGAYASGSIASGAMVDLGAQADSACSTDNGTCTEIALIKRTNQRLTTINSSIGAANAYETVAASQTAQAMGATGATGDYLSHCVVTPGTTSPGVVTILDNATAVVSFAGGASSVSNLVSFPIPIGAVSVSGAWKITTGANVTVVCVGRFT